MKNTKQIIEDHYNRQAADLVRIAKKKNDTPGGIQIKKHKYIARCLKLYMLSLYAVKYGDGTDARLQKRSFERKAFYLSKLTN